MRFKFEAASLILIDVLIVIFVMSQEESLGFAAAETDLVHVLLTCQDDLLGKIGQLSLDLLCKIGQQLVVKATILKKLRCQTYLERCDELKQRRPNLSAAVDSSNP